MSHHVKTALVSIKVGNKLCWTERARSENEIKDSFRTASLTIAELEAAKEIETNHATIEVEWEADVA